MAAISAWAAVAVGAAGVAASVSSSKKASSSAKKATEATLQIAQEARDATTRELRPWASAGTDALAEIRTLLGLPAAAPPAAQPQPSTGGTGGTGAQGGGWRDMFENLFADGGPPPASPPPPPPAPTTEGEPATPAPTGYEASFFSKLVDDAKASFETSPWWEFAKAETDDAINDLDSRYGASGLMLSGQALRARAEIAARMKGEAFDKHYNQTAGAKSDYLSALMGLSDRGMQAASGIGSGGQNYANTAATALTNNSLIRSQAQQQGTADALGFAGWTMGQVLNRPPPPPVVTPTGG